MSKSKTINDITEEIINLLYSAKLVKRSQNLIIDETSTIEELEFDALDFIELLSLIEEEFNIENELDFDDKLHSYKYLDVTIKDISEAVYVKFK